MRVSAQITLCVSSPWLVCCLQSWSWTTRFPIQWLRSSRPLCFVWQWCTEDSLSRIHGSENTGLACSIWLEIGIKSKIFSKTPTCGMRLKIVALKMDPCVMQWNSSGMPLGRWSPAASLLNLFPLIYFELRSPGPRHFVMYCSEHNGSNQGSLAHFPVQLLRLTRQTSFPEPCILVSSGN